MTTLRRFPLRRQDELLNDRYQLSPAAPPSLKIVLSMIRKNAEERNPSKDAGRRGVNTSTDCEVRGAIATLETQRIAAERKQKLLKIESNALRRAIAALEEKNRHLDEQLAALRLDTEWGGKEVQRLKAQVRMAAAELYGLIARESCSRDCCDDCGVRGRTTPGGWAAGGMGDGEEEDQEVFEQVRSDDTFAHLLQRESLNRAREENFIRFALRTQQV